MLMGIDVSDLRRRAEAFSKDLERTKAELNRDASFWYPYGTLSNLDHLDRLLTGSHRFLLDLAVDRRIADIGAADGDLAFFLETLGLRVDVVDHAPTNFNSLQGVRLLKEALKSTVEVFDVDLDSQFALPRSSYGLVFFLGILYHLKNPYYALEALSRVATYCLVSTRIAKFAPDMRTRLDQIPVAYLLGEREANNDPTNFWVLSDAGFRRLLARTGWEICDYLTVGNTTDSDPASPEGDERAFCLVRSRLAPV
jgi:tRNA (mo5U34)-methyltransferase